LLKTPGDMTTRMQNKHKQKYGRDAAREFNKARRMLDEARHTLAGARRSAKAPPYVFAGPWLRVNAALENHRGVLSSIPGVVGHGLGHRVRNGIETDEPCVVVFVRRKKTSRTLKSHGQEIPKSLRHGKVLVRTDIVEIDRLQPQNGPRGSIGPVGGLDFGTVGALGTDLDTGRPVAITAMHTFGQGNFAALPGQGIPVSSPAGGGRIGELVLGTTRLIDAAKIVLDAGVTVPPLLPVAGIRPFSNETNIVGRMFGATSEMEFGVVKYLNYNDLEDGLVNTLLVDIDSNVGDSGSGLVDNSGFLLGLLFGLAPTSVIGNLRVFCPANHVVSTLRCSIP
jgi:hypothetical protein